MVALVKDATGEPVGLHVTAIKADGSGKAFAENSRRMFGEVSGGAVRLGAIGCDGALVVAEGIETSLSFRALTSACVWACLSTSGLSSFVIPAKLRDLTVAADGDDAGLKAALTLVGRAAPTLARRIISAPTGLDWNDILDAAA
jgi:hypothetical protein